MIIFPAVDIQAGKAVRLKQGKKEEPTVYADDPLELALRWQDAGAKWLHIIDLDGAFSGENANLEAIERIIAGTNILTQVGGGIRTCESAERYLQLGVGRLIIGTAALEHPNILREMCAVFPGRIGVSLDAVNGRLKSRGWLKDASSDIMDILPTLEDAGVAFIIYTDINRDGMQAGINIAMLAKLLSATDIPVIAAGGVASLADIQALSGIQNRGNLEGAISGRALCEGTLDLSEANAWLEAQMA